MIDVRGTKEKNVNTSEIDICSRIVDKLLEINGEDYKKNIGIITPYKNQVNRLASNFKDISCGTVHAFQGKEKETIILSLVIDDPRNIGNLNFVGGKPNFLNVAFTRAKSQLIIVGNYEVCSTARNYLSKAIQTVKDYGTIYSVYEPDYFEKLRESIEQEFTPVSEHLELIDILPLPMAYVHKTTNALLICDEEADFLTLLSDRTVAPGFIEKIQHCLALSFRQCCQ